MQNKHWLIASLITPLADAELQKYPPIIRQVLFNRGIATEENAIHYMSAEPTIDTSPWQLTGMASTVDRIGFALDHNEPIAIYGDYDVDGVTATALMVETLVALGGTARGYIPNRFDEGYGLNNEALNSLNGEGVRLVISVDCGIRSPDEAAYAKELGLDLIITDHHQPAKDLPQAFAIVNPKQPGDQYPDKELAGVGVAFKIAEALIKARQSDFDKSQLLDLVALGTVADLAPLTGENRSLVRKGLQRIQSTSRQGLYSLANVAQLNISTTNATNIGFVLGPRLNAAGRLDSALAAFELLTTQDVMRAGQLALQLDKNNRDRQALTRQIQEQAEAIVLAEDPQADLLFAVHPDFNAGVVGLAASRLSEIYYRPAAVGQQSEETTRCSCRSIPEFHITQALDQCADLLVRHGGHAAAAGFTVRNENLPELKARLLAIAKKELGGRELRPTLSADGEIPLASLKPELLNFLSKLQPTGYGNPDAVFVTRGVVVKTARTVGADGKHLKLTVSDGKVLFDAIGFRLGHLQPDLLNGKKIDVMYTFETNDFNGRTYLQLNLRDVKTAGVSDY
jgi:single-stranded-DNA-specific exonuclease